MYSMRLWKMSVDQSKKVSFCRLSETSGKSAPLRLVSI